MSEDLAAFLDAAEACPGWADADRQFSYKNTLTDMVRAVVTLCEEKMCEDVEGGQTDADTLWPSEILAAMRLAVISHDPPPPKPKVCVGPCDCGEAT